MSDSATNFRGDAIWVTGSEKHSGMPLSVFYYGTNLCYDYLMRRLYSEHTVQRAIEGVNVIAGTRLLHTATSDLIVGDLAWPYHLAVPRARFLRIPPSLSHIVHLPSNWETLQQRLRKRRTTLHDVRKVEKFGLSYRTTNDRSAIERFYDTMYLPYATHRHGDSMEVEPKSLVVRLGTAGTLIEIMHDGRVVAGGIQHRIGGTMRALWLGIAGDLDRALSTAAGAGLYYYTMHYAVSEGCRQLDLMYAPADLDNGIHRYKRKLGARVSNEWPYGQLLISVANLTPAVVQLFARMPFATAARGNALNGRIMIAEEDVSIKSIRKVSAHYACEGLERLKIFSARPLSEAVLCADYAALDAGLPPLELYDLTRSTNPAADFSRD